MSRAHLAEFQAVTKWYGPVIGLNDVSLTFEPGITGLLGPNGAGKTTLIKLLAGQLKASLGRVSVCGKDAWSAAAKRHIGYCPDVDTFYEEMSGRRFVRTMALLHGLSRSDADDRTADLLELVDMTSRADRKLRGYSKGMRQRIKLAQALIHDPDMLVVDEPLNGVDPVGRRDLINLFRDLASLGKAVLVSSHILDEIETLAQRIVFMGRGRVLADGSLSEIRDMLSEYPVQVRIRAPSARSMAAELVAWETVTALNISDDDTLDVQVRQPEPFFRELTRRAAEGEVDVIALQTTDASAEAVFDYVMHQADWAGHKTSTKKPSS